MGTNFYQPHGKNNPEFFIDTNAGGRVTAEALLHSEGSVECSIASNSFPKFKCCIFHIRGENFCFNLGFINGQLIFQRNEFVLTMSESFFKRLPNNSTIIASWTPTELTLLLGHIGYVGPSIKRQLSISPISPPPSLVRWIRHQSLIPKTIYNTETEFVDRVHTYLSSVQSKVYELMNKDLFWDKQYKGNKLISCNPKKEKDLHGIIQGLLSDQCFLASIDVFPECASSNGRIDFMFLGSVKDCGFAKVCAEFKLAHSPNLEHGIEHQLPAYMTDHKTLNGAFCILDFRGDRFNKPVEDSTEMHLRLARAARRGWNSSSTHPIKIHHFYLGNKAAASKR